MTSTLFEDLRFILKVDLEEVMRNAKQSVFTIRILKKSRQVVLECGYNSTAIDFDHFPSLRQYEELGVLERFVYSDVLRLWPQRWHVEYKKREPRPQGDSQGDPHVQEEEIFVKIRDRLLEKDRSPVVPFEEIVKTQASSSRG